VEQRKLKKDNPKIIFWSDNVDAEYPKIEPASIRRDWMDKTYNKLAYKCTPLLDAMSNGWEIRLPQDVIVTWDGLSEGIEGEDSSHISILSGEFYNGVKIASTDTGVGAVTFVFGLIAETDDEHYLTVSGPPNYMFKDAQPLTGLLRSNRFMDHPLQLTWKINTANKEILFPKGMPVCFISIHKKNTAEITDVEIRHINKEKKEEFKKYTVARSQHFADHGQYQWPQFYKNGINHDGEKKAETIKKNKLKTIKYSS
jgi:glutaredoxin